MPTAPPKDPRDYCQACGAPVRYGTRLCEECRIRRGRP